MATVLREINSEIKNLEFVPISSSNSSRLLVKGEIEKQIIYVNNQGIVHYQNTTDPFEIVLNLPEPTVPEDLHINVEIEHISPKLISRGNELLQQIILKVTHSNSPGELGFSQNYLIRAINKLEDKKARKETVSAKYSLQKSKEGYDKISRKNLLLEKEEVVEGQINDNEDDFLLVLENEVEHDYTETKNFDDAENQIKTRTDQTQIDQQTIDHLQELRELISALENSLQDRVENSLKSEFLIDLKKVLKDQLKGEIEPKLREQIKAEMEINLRDQLKTEMTQEMELKLAKELLWLEEKAKQTELEKKQKLYDKIRKESIIQQIRGYKTRG